MHRQKPARNRAMNSLNHIFEPLQLVYHMEKTVLSVVGLKQLCVIVKHPVFTQTIERFTTSAVNLFCIYLCFVFCFGRCCDEILDFEEKKNQFNSKTSIELNVFSLPADFDLYYLCMLLIKSHHFRWLQLSYELDRLHQVYFKMLISNKAKSERSCV